MTFSIDNPRGVALGKYVWEKPSGEQGLMTSESQKLNSTDFH